MASVAPVYEDRRVSIGRVFRRALSALGKSPALIVGLALILGGMPSLALRYIASILIIGGPANAGSASIYRLLELMLVSMPFSLAVSSLAHAAMTRATVSAIEGRTDSFGACLETALAVFLPVVAMSIVSAIGVGLGLILFVVPGVILYLIWSVALPALVIERIGIFEALRRSAVLTKGAKWQIFGISLIFVLTFWGLSLVLKTMGLAMFDPAQSSGLTTGNVMSGILQTTAVLIAGGTLWPSLYLELRWWNEGESVHELAEVFA